MYNEDDLKIAFEAGRFSAQQNILDETKDDYFYTWLAAHNIVRQPTPVRPDFATQCPYCERVHDSRLGCHEWLLATQNHSTS